MSSSLPTALRRVARITAAPLLASSMLLTGVGTADATTPSWQTGHSATFINAINAIQVVGYVPLGYGSTHWRVPTIQRGLGVTPISGYFGSITRATVIRYQQSQHLPATGIVDITTYKFILYRWAVISAYNAAHPTSATRAASILSMARSVASGAYYVHGATGPKAFDCSGYVGYVLSHAVGRSLPRTSYDMRSALPTISSPAPGDLVFVYNGPGGRVGHVGIYAGSGYWWEASNPSTGVGLHRAWSPSVSYGRA